VVDQVLEALPPPAPTLLRNQLRSTNRVQRLLGGREVNLYRMRRGRPTQDPALAVPNRSREAVLARVRAPGADGAPPWEAELFLVDGFLFSIVFDRVPPEAPPAAAASVTIEADPMAPGSDGPQVDPDLLPADYRDRYAELASRGAGIDLLPPDEAYRIELDDGPFLVLAIVDGRGVLAVPLAAGASPDLFFIRYDRDAPRRRYGSVGAAIDELGGGSVSR
jgi:hypothetical protein